MLEYRNDELKIRMNAAIRDNGDQLRALTEQVVAENDSMKYLTQELYDDSKLIKILTFIAILYTPASLIAVSTLFFLCNTYTKQKCRSIPI
jgi:hypothetical protein